MTAYEKTIWHNDKLPAMNETNLNKIENGIKEAHDKIEENAEKIKDIIKTYILFDSQEGVVGDITLNDNIENYKYYEIYFGRSTWEDPWSIAKGMVRPAENNNYCALSSFYGYGGYGMALFTALATLKNNKLTLESLRNIVKEIQNNTINVSTNVNEIRIFRVLGYK